MVKTVDWDTDRSSISGSVEHSCVTSVRNYPFVSPFPICETVRMLPLSPPLCCVYLYFRSWRQGLLCLVHGAVIALGAAGTQIINQDGRFTSSLTHAKNPCSKTIYLGSGQVQDLDLSALKYGRYILPTVWLRVVSNDGFAATRVDT